MKHNTLLSILACALVLVLSSCSAEDKSAKVAEEFATAIATGDIEKAKSLCTEPTAQTIEFLNQMQVLPIEENFAFELENVVMNDTKDTAAVFYTTPNNKDSQKIDLIKNEEGDWKVNIRK